MEKFMLNFEYKAGNTVYKTSLFETPDFKLDYKASQKQIVLNLKTKVKLEILKLEIVMPYEFSADSRIFTNGYQSWTDCREMFVDDIPQHTVIPTGAVFKHTLLGASGAYSFVENTKKPGEFTAFSYMYVRNGEEFDLFASLTERTGYTIFKTDCKNNKLYVMKDLEGVVFDGEYEVLNIVNLKGASDEVFDEWFSLLNIKKPDAKPMNGYTTWYNYYPHINEKIVTDDLEALSKVDADIDIFQIDDGFQTATGDWLSVDPVKFPNGMKAEVEKIHAKNMLAGLWLAPFGAQFTSKLLKEHKDWFIKKPNGKLVQCGPNWGGFCALDIEIPEAREYIRHFFDVVLNEWGFDLVKLDFLYAVAIIPYRNKTRGQLMCEAMDFLLGSHIHHRLVDALPVVLVLSPAPLALESLLTLTDGHGIIEIPLSVALLLCRWGHRRLVSVASLHVLSLPLLLPFHLLGLLNHLGLSLLLFFLLQGFDHPVDGLQALRLGHCR